MVWWFLIGFWVFIQVTIECHHSWWHWEVRFVIFIWSSFLVIPPWWIILIVSLFMDPDYWSMCPLVLDFQTWFLKHYLFCSNGFLRRFVFILVLSVPFWSISVISSKAELTGINLDSVGGWVKIYWHATLRC